MSDLELNALALGKQLYEAFWQRQPAGAAAPDFDGQAAAIRDMWSGIAGDALSLISAARKGQGEWRPIESAPRDGSTVLVAHAHNGAIFAASWDEASAGWIDGATDADGVARPDARDAKTQRHAELQALLARVEAATGADRELDALVTCAVYPACTPATDDCMAGTYWRPMSGDQSLQVAENLSSSLDAALALVERVLPGHTWSVDGPAPHGIATILLPSGTLLGSHLTGGTTPPLALLAALLKALLSSEEQPSVCEQREQSAPATDEHQ